jgi:hypothetical protein
MLVCAVGEGAIGLRAAPKPRWPFELNFSDEALVAGKSGVRYPRASLYCVSL